MGGDAHPAPFVCAIGGVPSAGGFVESILDALEAAAVELFPAWLPEAEGITGIGGSSEPAVRALALRVGSTTEHHGPYLAELASRALRRHEPGPTGFPAEVRARGAARVLAATYGRASLAVIAALPEPPERPELSPTEESCLVDGAAFLVRHGRLAVWLTGPALRSVDSVPELDLLDVALPVPPTGGEQPTQPPVWYAPVAGRPHPASFAEQTLESALATSPWATGRTWNQTHETGPLAAPIRLDLAWPRERLVVEIDGPEHRNPNRFEADRRRDLQLTLDGFTVVRFTNDSVADDVTWVVSQLEQLVQTRRRRPQGGPGP